MLETCDLYWLAGLLEGEGSFLAPPPSSPNRPRISLQMTDRDVVDRAARMMGVAYVYVSGDRRNANWKRYYMVVLRGRRAARLMRMLRPLMGARRQVQIDDALAGFVDRAPGENTRKLTPGEVLTARELLAAGESVSAVARQFHVSRYVIRSIRDRRSWKAA